MEPAGTTGWCYAHAQLAVMMTKRNASTGATSEDYRKQRTWFLVYDPACESTRTARRSSLFSSKMAPLTTWRQRQRGYGHAACTSTTYGYAQFITCQHGQARVILLTRMSVSPRSLSIDSVGVTGAWSVSITQLSMFGVRGERGRCFHLRSQHCPVESGVCMLSCNSIAQSCERAAH